MQASDVRLKFLKFFEDRGHKIIPSSSLIPENDPSVLFTTAGMQQFKPYYLNSELAEKDFDTKNVTTVQKCVRTGDIDEVGDNTHLTFFEMLGNFSFGGYGRENAIKYAHEFITKEMGLDISYVTVYEGNKNVIKDEESKKIWESLGVKNIKEEGSDVFWGPTGDSGPCGPTTEIYCKNASGEDVEIWNIVFNEFFCDGSREKLDKGEANLTKLPVLGIDTGMGLERLVTIVQKKESVYDTDLFNAITFLVKEIAKEKFNIKNSRILMDHIRTSVMMISDGVVPGNKDRGYVLRRLVRSATMKMRSFYSTELLDKKESGSIFYEILNEIYKIYVNTNYIRNDKEYIFNILLDEEIKFRKTLEAGLKEFEKLTKRYFFSINDNDPEKFNLILGHDAFDLFQTYGFPIELTVELAKEKGIKVDVHTFEILKEEHSVKSSTASAGMFKGGLSNHNEKTIRLHTAHHLLLSGLQEIVNKDIKQKGSNITEERLRMDFICDHKLTDEEKQKTEDWVNDKIKKGLDVVRKEMPLVEAEKIGAQMEFGAKYPEVVSVYFIEDKNGNAISKEFCGGPHVNNTSELGTFKILKEEAVASGVRRIKAVLS